MKLKLRMALTAGVAIVLVGAAAAAQCVVPDAGASSPATAQAGARDFRAALNGLQEVPPVSTTGVGSFRARLSGDGRSLSFQLSLARLEGSNPRAMIHFAQRGANGGMLAWLCGESMTAPQGTFPAPEGTPACPAQGQTLRGTLDAGDVHSSPQAGPAWATGQGIGAGEFAEVIHVMRRGLTYVQVHTEGSPINMLPGEIRGQIVPVANRRGRS